MAVIGIGGIGASAVQGARLAGAETIFAIDPVQLKRDLAPTFGATHTAASIEEAFGLIHQETWGHMCDKVICAMGVGSGGLMDSILNLAAKRGRVVVTNIHPYNETDVTMNLMMLTIYEKQVVGSIFGSANIHSDIPKLLKLYRNGQLDLDSMITNTYKLGRHQPGLPGHAGRQEHPRRPHLRRLTAASAARPVCATPSRRACPRCHCSARRPLRAPRPTRMRTAKALHPRQRPRADSRNAAAARRPRKTSAAVQ